MVQIAAFVERFYPVIVPIVIFIAIYWFVLGHERALFLPFVFASVLVVGLSFALRIGMVFLISLPSMAIGLTFHLMFAAWLSSRIRKLSRVFFSPTSAGSN